MKHGIREFESHPWLKTGHAQTIAAAFLRRKFAVEAGEERLFRVDSETRLKGICHWQSQTPKGSRVQPNYGGQAQTRPALHHMRRDLPVVVIVHGLEGSCGSNYSWGIADKAFARGFHAVRMNQRNCGGTEKLTPTLYNSGLSGDYRAVLMNLIGEGFQQIYFVGYSMGGNLVTKMAGEFGAEAPKELKGVAAVCPALDLSACADALERPANFLYERHFVKALLARYRRKCELFPERYTQNGLGRIRTVREFDDEITAPHFGFRDAEEYYQAASAKKVIKQVHVPMLMMTAQDDPFVPYESFARAGVEQNPCVQFVSPKHGGHCGFISRFAGAERFWAEQRIVDFVEEEGGKEVR
jgi:predicted alpha/beta-fold hydrolase